MYLELYFRIRREITGMMLVWSLSPGESNKSVRNSPKETWINVVARISSISLLGMNLEGKVLRNQCLGAEQLSHFQGFPSSALLMELFGLESESASSAQPCLTLATEIPGKV